MAYQRSDDDEQQHKPQGEQMSLGQGGGLLSGYMQAKPATSQGSGPTVTGHINFDSIYAANEATAQRDAAKMGNQAAGLANKARGGLLDMQSKFSTQSKAGYSQGIAPAASDAARAKGGGTPFYSAPPVAARPSSTPAGMSSVSPMAQAGPQTANPIENDTEAAFLDRLKQGASKKYTGPNSLQDVEGFGGLLKDYGKTEEAMKGLGSNEGIQGLLEQQAQGPHIEGGSKLDAALIGQAGRPG
jgi:hypothetical protein